MEFNLDEKEEYFTPREIAERFGVSNTAVISWLTHGRLEGFRVGNLWKVKKEALLEFVERCSGG